MNPYVCGAGVQPELIVHQRLLALDWNKILIPRDVQILNYYFSFVDAFFRRVLAKQDVTMTRPTWLGDLLDKTAKIIDLL